MSELTHYKLGKNTTYTMCGRPISTHATTSDIIGVTCRECTDTMKLRIDAYKVEFNTHIIILHD